MKPMFVFIKINMFYHRLITLDCTTIFANNSIIIHYIRISTSLICFFSMLRYLFVAKWTFYFFHINKFFMQLFATHYTIVLYYSAFVRYKTTKYEIKNSITKYGKTYRLPKIRDQKIRDRKLVAIKWKVV